ncbi:BrnA antitoxin family protein [Thiothrix fructosivorans]|jgi:uncharacterized protein (DUF4415 family)|uniref:BrnA antitoxin family protein n=1 Tax=Thiothrix fructosivorans TaxID=111770 RepID=A0A8B0SGQ1_9GAMM|nr:BrnA antitoxin family protein [Thiothrix fructosivorans]MBO0613270.1 BrnA antitoxin family protein [Thiothrix fructosivorans]QTX11293.1 BrnA antitoxin family protein [Thiothrix fructosivorans]
MLISSKSGRVFEMPTDEEDARIRAGIAADPDTYEMTAAEMKLLRPVGRPKAESTKERVTVRLSEEVTAYFRATGKGWQTRMDAVLKEYVGSHRA